MKKYVLWKEIGREEKFVIPAEEIEEVIFLGDDTWVVEGLPYTEETEEKLRSLESELKDLDWKEEVQEVLEKHFPGDEIEVSAPDYVRAEDKCFLVPMDGRFYMYAFRPEECDSVPTWSYWDGHDWKMLTGENASLEPVVVDEEREEILDEWDGSNWYFRTRFNHGKLYPVIERDGEVVEDEYLLVEYSQYEGSIPTGKIIDEEEREELLQQG